MSIKSQGIFGRLLSVFREAPQSRWESATVARNYRAMLYPTDAAGQKAVAAELGFASFAEGHSQFEVDLKDSLSIPEGEYVQVYVNNEKVCDAPITKDTPDYMLDSRRGGAVPRIQANDQAVVAYRGKIILNGTFGHRV